jgi:uncharacterized membrane protein YeiH
MNQRLCFIEEEKMELISILELVGTVAFAVSGALLAIDKELDYYGIAFLAIITAVGGGIFRDVLINDNLPAALENPLFAIISILSAAATVLFYSKIIKYANVLQFFDAVGLGAFTAIGANVAVQSGLDMPFVIITLALLTGTGGGALRDVFAKEIPFVFRKEIYAVAAVVGAIFYIIINARLGNTMVALYTCFFGTLAIRLCSMKFNLHLKKVKRKEGEQ